MYSQTNANYYYYFLFTILTDRYMIIVLAVLNKMNKKQEILISTINDITTAYEFASSNETIV